MRKTIFFIFLVMLFSVIRGQSPQGISHQAVIRNAANELVISSPIGIKVSILQGSAEGTVVYSETHLPTSNANGLISFVIGQGTVVSGLFAEVDWAAGPYFIKTETDPEGGNNYTITGTSQLLSVPYALHAKTAEKVEGSVAANIYPPSVIATAASNIESFSATINGIVNAEGFISNVSFEWGNTTDYGDFAEAIPNPITGSTDVMVSADLSGLQSANTYHYRLRANNAVNTSYSDDMPFTTEPSVPLLTTNAVTNILAFSAKSGGDITYDGGSPVTARGVVWSINPEPTLYDHFTIDGSGTGSFTSEMTGLTHATIYYVRAYATNAVGTTYGNQLSFTTYAGIPGEPCIGSETMTDFDGNGYITVVIATQCWMKENLKTTKYRNGITIENPTGDYDWQNNTSGAYAWYNNDIGWKDSYGALYNWHAVNNTNGLCPTGWHVPTDAEFTAMTNHLGGANVAGGKMKSTRTAPDSHPRWESPNFGATNESNWSGYPGGVRFTGGIFTNLGSNGYWWSATGYSITSAWFRFLNNSNIFVYMSDGDKLFGFSVRCLKD